MSKCEWPAPSCDSMKARPVEIVNVFGEKKHLRYCDEHIAISRDPQKMADLQERLMTSWAATQPVITPQQLHDSEIQKRLTEHTASCGICGPASAWVRGEIAAGRVRNQDDTNRIGEYIIAHYCDAGVYLTHEAGMEMKGLR